MRFHPLFWPRVCVGIRCERPLLLLSSPAAGGPGTQRKRGSPLCLRTRPVATGRELESGYRVSERTAKAHAQGWVTDEPVDRDWSTGAREAIQNRSLLCLRTRPGRARIMGPPACSQVDNQGTAVVEVRAQTKENATMKMSVLLLPALLLSSGCASVLHGTGDTVSVNCMEEGSRSPYGIRINESGEGRSLYMTILSGG
jgi:hypothetical protein